jgi:hypothetical protein
VELSNLPAAKGFPDQRFDPLQQSRRILGLQIAGSLAKTRIRRPLRLFMSRLPCDGPPAWEGWLLCKKPLKPTSNVLVCGFPG